jgi:ElaB/YqjD/DUF883 family membrane-anchored ribosome-binding protein
VNTRILNIVHNQLVVDIQKTEQELEEVLNKTGDSVDHRLENILKLLDKVTRLKNSQEVFNNYVEKLNNLEHGVN